MILFSLLTTFNLLDEIMFKYSELALNIIGSSTLSIILIIPLLISWLNIISNFIKINKFISPKRLFIFFNI